MKDSKPVRAGRSDVLGDVAKQAAAGRAAAALSAWAVGEPIRTDAPPPAAASIFDWDTLVDELQDLSAEVSGLRSLAVQALLDIAEGCADPRERARVALDRIIDSGSEQD